MVIITDQLYGSFEFPERIDKLLMSKSMQRLKKIHQSGAAFFVDPELNHTRYEHSIGAMLLVKFLGGGEDAQVAALLHDVSHTIFSHISDQIFNEGGKSYHESIRENYLAKSELMSLLVNMGFDAKYVLDIKKFPVVDIEIPDLSVDRLDYLFRDMYAKNLIRKTEIKKILSQLIVDREVIKCKNVDTAKFLFNKFITLNLKIFFDGGGEAANAIFSSVLRRLIKDKVISCEDMMQDDEYIIEKINNTKYKSVFSVMKPDMEYRIHYCSRLDNEMDAYNIFMIKRKLRYVDPLVIGINNNVANRRITEIDVDSKKRLNKYLKTERIICYEIPALKEFFKK